MTSIQFSNSPSAIIGGKFSPNVIGTYASLTNNVNVTTLAGVTYTSDNTNIVSFGTDGNFHANAAGTTTIHASYLSKSAALSVTVNLEPAVIVHRYGFNEAAGTSTITDSVGGANGTLVNGTATATLDGAGTLTLDGNSSSAYVSLPSGIMGKLTNATFQVWFKNTDLFSDWAELFAFGTNNGSQGLTYITLIPNNPASHALRFENKGVTDTIIEGPALPTNNEVCVTVTYNYSAQLASMYVAGRKVSSATMTLPLYTIPDGDNYIGQSQWYGSGDPYLNGVLNEFRIYSGVESDLQIAIDAVTGPNTIVNEHGSLLSLSVKLQFNRRCSWPRCAH